MDEDRLAALLRLDLQRTGNLPGDDVYLPQLVQAAIASLGRQGVHNDGTEDYTQTVVSTAAWMYRKRINGESEPEFLKRMRKDLIISSRIGR